MSHVQFQEVIGDDASALERWLGEVHDKPLLLWGHREVGRAALVEAAAAKLGLPFRQMEARLFEGWDGFRDLSDSGSFRPVTLESFLEKGERADPDRFTLEPGQVLYIRGLNRISVRLIETVLEQLLDERKLLNNPVPDDIRVVAGVYPKSAEVGRQLLGPRLEPVWAGLANRSQLDYPVYPLSDEVTGRAEHWSVLPSLQRFLTWARARDLAPEVIHYLEWEARADEVTAMTSLFAAIVTESDPLSQPASPHSFAELASLLTERRLYFSGRTVKQALADHTDRARFQEWLNQEIPRWDPELWIDAEASNTLHGEPVTGAEWLKSLLEEVRDGRSEVAVESLLTYAAFERRSLAMWATQELGDEVGGKFVEATAVTERDVAHLTAGG